MPRVSIIKTNFTAGELSPRLLARVDIAKYGNGAGTLLNAYSFVHGGVRRREGTRYTAAAKNAAKLARLIGFVFSRTQAFALEFGEQYVRFYTPSGQIESSPGTPYEVATPWDDTELVDLHYAQSADTMFLAHQSYAMRRLVRYANTNWKLSTIVWEVPPTDEIGERPSATLSLSGTSGVGVTATASAASFEASDVGRYLESGSGRGIITAYSSATQVTVTIAAADAFASTGPIAANSWKVTGSPQAACTPSATGPEGATITLTLAAAGWKSLAAIGHVGSFVAINDGMCEITAYTSTTVVDAKVRTVLASTTAAPVNGWALEQPVWNAVDGYPRAVTLQGQRLYAAGSPAYPNTVWGSRIGEYLNFARGTQDSDGFAFALAADPTPIIEHLVPGKRLTVLAYGGELTARGGNEKPIAPTNVQVDGDTEYGCSAYRPVRVGSEVIFSERGGKKVRAMGYRAEADSYNAPDVSVLSEHIVGDGLQEVAYKAKPDQVAWFVRADGAFVSMSIDRDQDVISFASSTTDGESESVCVIPNGSVDQLWALVARSVGGSTVRYVERFEDGLQTDCCVTGAVAENTVTGATWSGGVLTITRVGHGYASGAEVRLSGFTPDAIDNTYTATVTGVDAYTVPLADDPGAITVLGTDATPTAAWSGLSHLNGKTVRIVADGYVAASKTVSAGAVTLDKAAYEVEIGLDYITTITDLPPEVGTGTGTAQGNAISIHEIVVRFYQTKGGTVNGQPINARSMGTGAVLDQPVPSFTGDRRVEALGWGRTGGGDFTGAVSITQDQPLPMTVLGIVKRLSVNDG